MLYTKKMKSSPKRLSKSSRIVHKILNSVMRMASQLFLVVNMIIMIKLCVLTGHMTMAEGAPVTGASNRSSTSMNLYLKTDEMRRLLGLNAELYYLREGKVNDYALQFVVPVPPHISELHFTWQSLVPTPIPYTIGLSVSDLEALDTPTINITRKGTVPQKETVFRITLPCSGHMNAEVDIEILINVTMSISPYSSNVTSLVLKRKKICLKVDPPPEVTTDASILDIAGGTNSNNHPHRNDVLADASAMVVPSDPLYVLVAGASGLILVLSLLATICYVRSQKGRQTTYGGSRTHLSPSKAGQTYLRVETGEPKMTTQSLLTGTMTMKSESASSGANQIQHPPYGQQRTLQKMNGLSGSVGSSIHTYNSIHGYSTLKSATPSAPPPPAPQTNIIDNPLLGSSKYINHHHPPSHHRSLTLSTQKSNASSHSGSGIYHANNHHVGSGTMSSTATTSRADLRVERSRIKVHDKVFEGTYSQIYIGYLLPDEKNNQQQQQTEYKAMVKTVSQNASQMQASLLLHESMMMIHLNHPNVLPLMAYCVDDPQRPLILYPYCNQGNLKIFLQNCKFSSEGHVATLLTQDLVDMALQIVRGMIYLHKKRIIHRDLAARNCVVDKDESTGALVVKISDTALSRDLFSSDYHCLGDNENRPIKWLAIEALLLKQFSEASDVWSFGVLLWELMTLGLQPYLEVDPFEMSAYLQDGYRLYQPINCPDKLYEMMICCWNGLPEDRPTFAHLHDWLQDFALALNKFV